MATVFVTTTSIPFYYNYGGIGKVNLFSGRGRRSVYDPTYHPRIVKWMSRDGATDEDIAKEFGISVRQLYRWYRRYPELCQAKEDKFVTDMQVEDSVLKQALGYEVEETEVIASKDGRPTQVRKRKIHIPPSLKACRMWLINRQPGRWPKSDKDN